MTNYYDPDTDPAYTDPTFDALIDRPLLTAPKRNPTLGEDIYNSLMNSFPALMADRITDNVVYDTFTKNQIDGGEAVWGGGDRFDKWGWFKHTQHLPDEVSSYDSEVNTYHDALKWEAKRVAVLQRKADLAASGFSGAALQFYSDLALSPSGVASMAVPFGPLAKGGLILRASKMSASGAALGSAYSFEKNYTDPTFTTEERNSSIATNTAVMGLIGAASPTLLKLAGRGHLSSGSDDPINSFSDKFVNDASHVYSPDSPYYNKDQRTLSSAGAGFNFDPVGPIHARAAVRIAAIMSPANRVANFVTQESKNFFSKIAGRPSYYTKGEAIGETASDSVVDLRRPVEMDYQMTIDAVRGDLKSYIEDSLYKQRKPGVIEKLSDIRRINKSMNTAYDDLYSITMNRNMSIEDILSLSEGSGAESYLYKAAYKIRKKMQDELQENLDMGLEHTAKLDNYGGQFMFNKNAARLDSDNLFAQLKGDTEKYVDELRTKYINEYKDAGAVRQAMEKELDDYKKDSMKSAGNNSEKITRLENEIEDARKEMEEILSLIDDADNAPSLLASKLLSEIIHGKSPSVTYIRGNVVSEKPGFFMHRHIDPLAYQKWAEKRPEVLLQMRARQIGTRRAMKRLYGDSTGRAARKEYAQKMDEIIAAQREKEVGIKKETDNTILGKAKRKINKEATADELVEEKNSVLKQFDDLLDLHLGEYNSDFYSRHPYLAFGAEALKTWNELTMLGNVVAGSIAEAAAIQMHHGISATMPAYKKVLEELIKNPAFYHATVKELKAMGHAFEWSYFEMIQDIIGQGGNIGDQYVSGFTVMQNMKKYFYLANGLTMWDHFNRLVIAKTQMTVLSAKLRKIAAGKASKYDIMDMAKLGISEGQAKAIVKEFDLGGEEVINGLSFMRPEKMSPKIAERFKIALTNDIYRTALKSRTGELPISMAHPAVSLVAQFKSWPMLATQKYMIPLMQRSDGSSMSAVATMAGFGVLAYMAKEKLAGKDLSTQDYGDILYGGITQSGVFGITPELFLDWAANKVGIEGGSARYSGINPLINTIVGPSATTIGRVDQAAKIFPGGKDPTDWSYQSMWKLLPFSNHPVFTVEP